MKTLTALMVDVLCDLYNQTEGRAGVAYPTDAHWRTIEGLFERNLILRDAQIEGGKVRRYIALSPFGAQYSCEHLASVINANGIKDHRPRRCVALFFEMTKVEHQQAYRRVGELKAQRDFRPTMIDLLRMDKELEAGQVDLFMSQYPEALQTIRLEIQREVQSQANDQFQAILNKLSTMAIPAGLLVNPNSEATQPATPIGGIKQIGGLKPLAPPAYDDDDDDLLVVKKAEGGGGQAAKNFINAMMALQD